MAKIYKSSGGPAKKPRRVEKSISSYERPDLDSTPTSAESLEAETPMQRAERIFQDAYDAGFRQGAEAGLASFLEQVGDAHRSLESSGEALRQAHAQFLNALEPQLVELAKMVAGRILRRESRTDHELVRRTVRAALENLAERQHAILHLNPQDIAALTERGISLEEEFRSFERVEIVSDENVARGGCTVETKLVDIDARLDTQLTRIFEALEE